MGSTLRVLAAVVVASLAPTPPLAARLAAATPSAEVPAVSVMPSPTERMAAAEQAFAAASRPTPQPVEQLVALYRVEEIGPLLATAATEASLDRLSATPHLDPLVAAEIANARAGMDLRRGDAAAASAVWRGLGVIEAWQGVGPFDNSSPSAIETNNGPETAIQFSAHYQGKQRQVSWRPLPFTPTRGELSLSSYFSPSQSASAYLVSWVRSPRAQAVALRLRDSGSTRIWVNGAPVFDEQGTHPSSGFDQHAAGAQLKDGWNEILAKVGDSETADWRFSLRVTTPAGAPLELEATATPPAGWTDTAVAATATTATAGDVRDLTAMAKAAASSSAGEELDYAWVLTRKKNFNTGDHDDANAFMAAIAAMPGNEQAVLDFVEHDTDPSRIYQYLEQLLEKDPGNARAHFLLGTVELSRNEYWPSRADFEDALGWHDAGVAEGQAAPSAETPQAASDRAPQAASDRAPQAAIDRAPQAALGMLETFAGMGVRPEVLAWATALEGQPSVIAGPVGTTLRRMGVTAAALQWFEAAHASNVGDLNLALELADEQRRGGEFTASLATVRQALELDGENPSLYAAEAQALEGLGRGPEALAVMEKAVALAPDTPDLRVAEGEIERHFGHAAAAVADWQAAYNLNPQDSDLRDRLRLAQGAEAATEASFERPYTQDLQKTIAAYKAKMAALGNGPDASGGGEAGWESGPVVVLADTSVTNIFPSGNTGRYEQQIFRVNNSNGADSLAVYSVTYDPATEEVRFLTAHVVHADGSSADAPEAGDEPISQSVGYETFYDVRNKYVQMPPMRPGDFVEIAYRVLPTTLESLYGDYYGDLDPFGSAAPTVFQQYVVITPANKNLYSKAIRFGGPEQTAEQSTANGEKIYRWSARDLPAQVQEPLAPPAIEQVPYIAVSSFENWDQFGRWYTGLIRDTFVMDDEMNQTVAGLIQGKTSVEDKVDAIYRYVIQNTHYVALEFGIHGYRPYPVTQVFHRRFGDCKDKASLLIAMLHQAGVESEFVLVRVRELGVIDPTIPAVADFDHAIVYVPALHRYLDGTAEYNGADELPGGDQRAFVLRIPVGADLSAGGGAAAITETALHTPPQDKPPALAPEVTPEQPPTTNTISRTMFGQLDAEGNLRFQLHWVLAGGEAPEFRQALELPDRQAGALQAMLHDRLPGIIVLHAEVTNDNHWDQPIEVNLEGTIPRFASVNGKTLLVPRQILPTAWLPKMAALGERQQPVLTDPPEILQEEMQLALPAGYTAVLPPASQMDQPFANFEADAQSNGTTLVLRSRIETKQALIPVDEYGAFRTFWSQVDGALGRPVTTNATTNAN